LRPKSHRRQHRQQLGDLSEVEPALARHVLLDVVALGAEDVTQDPVAVTSASEHC